MIQQTSVGFGVRVDQNPTRLESTRDVDDGIEAGRVRFLTVRVVNGYQFSEEPFAFGKFQESLLPVRFIATARQSHFCKIVAGQIER